MNLLLHCCCGPCTVGALPLIEQAGFQPFCWFQNPNIQPWQEHKARKLAFAQFMEQTGLPHEISSDYPLEEWLQAVSSAPEARCAYCYQTRLESAAQKAKQLGFSAFTSTLLISPYQNHDLLQEIGNSIAAKQGLEFVYIDLRPRFREGQKEAREMGLYMQKYCGCIYSEKERYLGK